MDLIAQASAEALWERLLFGYGPLGLIVFGVFWLAWKYGPRLFEGHINMMSTLEKAAVDRGQLDRRNTDALETLSQSRLAAEDASIRTAKAVEEIANTQKKIADDLVKQTELQKSLHDKVDKIPSLLVNVIAPGAEKIEHHEHIQKLE